MKKQTNRIVLKLQLLACAGVTALFAGCATSGYEQADKTGAGIAEFRNEVVNTKKAVDGAMINLGKISESAATDPRKAFEAFSDSVNDVQSARAKAGKRATEMKASGAAYFQQWEKQMAEIANPDIRELAEKRKAKLAETFGKIAPLLEEAKTDFDPFMSNLVDLRTFLSNDLTVGGVDAAKGIIKKTRDNGKKLQGSLDDLIGEMNSISAALTPAKAAAK